MVMTSNSKPNLNHPDRSDQKNQARQIRPLISVCSEFLLQGRPVKRKIIYEQNVHCDKQFMTFALR